MTTPRFVRDPGGSPGGAVADESVLRVAACQDVSVPGDVPANVASAVRLVTMAAGAGARLVVLPELFLTGYDPACWTASNVVGPWDPRLAPLAEACARHRVVALVGAAVVLDSSATGALDDPPVSPTNRVGVGVLCVDDAGDVHAAYAKQHLFDSEQAFFTAGRQGASVTVDGWHVGLGVCYDGCFPEHAMAAAAAGAEVYVCPAAYFAGSDHRRDLYYAARALDNGIYVVLSGLTGPCGDHDFGGGSAVYDPEGRALDRVGAEAPAVAVADLRRAEVRRVQDVLNPIGRDRVARQAALGDAGVPPRHHLVLTR